MRIANCCSDLRASLGRHAREIGGTNIFLLMMLAVILFYPLLFVGFTTNDDANIAIDFGHDSIWQAAWEYSFNQGRFSFWWQYPLFYVPYAVDNRLWYLVVKFGLTFMLLGAIFYAVFQLFRSSWIALAALVFFLGFIQNSWDHNLVTSLPFVYNFFASLFLLSIGLFSQALARKSVALAYLAALLYFFALANEAFALFFPFYIAVILMHGAAGESILDRFRAGQKYLLAVTLGLAAYVATYLLWQRFYPSGYSGNTLYWSDLGATANVIATFSLSALPLPSLHFLVSPEDQLRLMNSSGWRTIVAGLTPVHLIKPAIVGLLFLRLLTVRDATVPAPRTLIAGGALALAGIFLPNVLLGFTKQYQILLAAHNTAYLYTYHSFVSAVICAALFTAYLTVKSRSWRAAPRLAMIITGVVAMMVLSFAVEVRNEYIAFDQKLSHRKWELMDVVIRSPDFRAIPDGAIVVAPTLSGHQRGNAHAPSYYWSSYTKFKTGKNVTFVDDKCVSGRPCYSLLFRQEKHGGRIDARNQSGQAGDVQPDERDALHPIGHA